MAISECLCAIDDNGLELVEHGNSAFPIAIYNDNLAEETVEWHWHQEMELILVTEGESLITAGSQKFVVTEGNGIFINSEVLHSGFLADLPNCRYHSFVFHPSLIGGNMLSIYWNRYLLPLIENKSLECVYLSQEIAWQKEVMELTETGWQALANETPGYEFLVREVLSKMIFAITTNLSAQNNFPSQKELRDGERMKRMMQYVSEHFSEEITIADLSQCAMISESECLRCFHNTIATTPIQYVKQFRIHKAAALLSTTDLKIVDIGSLCGFQEMSYFAKSFKKVYGCTPSKYRIVNGLK